MLLKGLGFWAFALAALTSSAGERQAAPKLFDQSELHLEADQKTVVRFFYDPPGEYFHVPLVLRVVDDQDPLLNTAPVKDAGRTAYMSLPEMRELLRRMKRANLVWEESADIVTLGSYKKLPLFGDMRVLVANSMGTARTRIVAKTICRTLQPLDTALKTPRALWEFQIFRIQYGCKVPGFKAGAHPDHF